MTRYKVEFEVAVKDGDEEGVRSFTSQLQRFVDQNVPANSGWTKTVDPKLERVYGLFEDRPKDPRWEAILEWIEKRRATNPLATRSVCMESGKSGGHLGSLSCLVKLYDDRTCTTKSAYLVSATVNTVKFLGPLGSIVINVDGPFEDASDEYWQEAAKNWSDRAIITEDWVHRTVQKDDPKAVASGGGGHGGAEFQFVITDDAYAARLKAAGLKIKDYNHDGEDWYLLTTRNCWHQGTIPAKHRHLFKVNAKMVQGFNPTVML